MCAAYIGVSARVCGGIVALAAVSFAAAAEPVEVRGDSAHYSADGKRAEFDGNVVLQSGGATVHAARLVVSVLTDGNHYRVSGSPARAECGECAAALLQLFAPEIVFRDGGGEIFSAAGGLTLCAGESCARGQLTADSAEWRRAEGEAHLRGTPVDGFWLPEDGGAAVRLRADEVDYARASGDVHLRGAASLSRGDEEIRGDSIKLNLKTGAVSAAGDGGGSRVRGVFGADE